MKDKWMRFKTDKEYRMQLIMILITILVVIATVLPIVLASSMSFYRGDDFFEGHMTINDKKGTFMNFSLIPCNW